MHLTRSADYEKQSLGHDTMCHSHEHQAASRVSVAILKLLLCKYLFCMLSSFAQSCSGLLWRDTSVCWTMLIAQGMPCLLGDTFVHQGFELRLHFKVVSQLQCLHLHTGSSCVGFQ